MQAATRGSVPNILSAADIEARLEARYTASGFSYRTWENDRALYRRLVKAVGHPADVTVEDMETIVLSATRTNSRAIYVERFKSIWQLMRELKVIPNDCRPDEDLPSIRRTKGLPRPLTPDQLFLLTTSAREPYRSWFILGAYAGLRAMEVANLRGADLEDTADGYVLRVIGKGRTEATIPAHPAVVEVIRNEGRLGRLWDFTPNTVARLASREMRRLGVNATFHACRHTFATSVLAASGDITMVKTLMRHQSIDTSMIYAKIADDKPRSVLAQLTMPTAPPPPPWDGSGWAAGRQRDAA